MKFPIRFAWLLSVFCVVTLCSAGQQQLGRIDFPNSGAAEAQQALAVAAETTGDTQTAARVCAELNSIYAAADASISRPQACGAERRLTASAGAGTP